MSAVIVIETASEDGTQGLGRALGALLEPGDVVALRGELGAGKTVLAQGIAAALGFDGYASSPSFVIVNEYRGRIDMRHVDLYRIADESEIDDLGYRELFFGDGVAVVEWADRGERFLPADRVDVLIELRGRDRRAFTFTSRGPRSETVVRGLAAAQAAS
jgi:tRNA threonylcarbamoyladenosine biosynthesis protein TsaE